MAPRATPATVALRRLANVTGFPAHWFAPTQTAAAAAPRTTAPPRIRCRVRQLPSRLAAMELLEVPDHLDHAFGVAGELARALGIDSRELAALDLDRRPAHRRLAENGVLLEDPHRRARRLGGKRVEQRLAGQPIDSVLLLHALD